MDPRKDESYTSPASPSPVQLSDDILHYSILPRLPFPALARFAAVCRAWRALIHGDAAFARMQAQTPSPASVALAHLRDGRLELLAPCPGAAPPDPALSFLFVDSQLLQLGAYANGLLCLAGSRPYLGLFFLVANPATRKFVYVEYQHAAAAAAGDASGVFVAGLAFDPSASPSRYHLVTVFPWGAGDAACCRFLRFSSETGAWRESQDTVSLSRDEDIQPKAQYAGGRLHWLGRRVLVWYDADEDRGGALPLPPLPWTCTAAGSHGLGVWHGRLRLVVASSAGVVLWALADGDAGWDMLLYKRWAEVPGMVRFDQCFCQSVTLLEPMAEEAVYLLVRTAAKIGENRPDLWRRVLVRYDAVAGIVETVKAVGPNEKLGMVFSYHSSMAALPTAGTAVT